MHRVTVYDQLPVYIDEDAGMDSTDQPNTLRTAEQTQIGIFWGYDGSPGLSTPPRLYSLGFVQSNATSSE